MMRTGRILLRWFDAVGGGQQGSEEGRWKDLTHNDRVLKPKGRRKFALRATPPGCMMQGNDAWRRD